MKSFVVVVDADDTSDDTADNAVELFNFLILLMGVDYISISISDITVMLVAFIFFALSAHFCS